MVLGILAEGLYIFDQERKDTLRNAENMLTAIADLKVQQVIGWRAERISDAELLGRNPIFSENVQAWLRHRGNAAYEHSIRKVLGGYVGEGDIANAILIDPNGDLLLAAADYPDIPQQTRALLPDIASSEKTQLTDPIKDHRDRVVLDTVTPIYDSNHRLIAFIVLRLDAGTFLFPFIHTWPTPSPSAETLLAMRDGDSVLFINETRHTQHTGLTMRRSLKDTALPATNAVLGYSRIMRGRDYRGVEVLAATRPLPGTRWGMVAKVDWQEVTASQMGRQMSILLMTLLLAGVAIAVVVAFWRKAFLLAVDRHVNERNTLENRLRQIIDLVPHFIFAKDKQGRFILANKALATAYGTTVDKLIGKRDSDFNGDHLQVTGFLNDDHDVLEKLESKLIHKEEISDSSGNRRLLQTMKIPLAMDDGEYAVLGVSTDITDLVASEEQLRLMAKIFEYSHEAFLITDANNQIMMVNSAFCELTGYTEEEVRGLNPRILATGQTLNETYREMWHALKARGYWQGEIWDKRKDGTIYPKWLSIAVVLDPDGKVVNYVASFSDMTERKQAEAKIHHLAHHDVLTGLPNRLTLELRLEDNIRRANRRHEKLAVMFIDLDRFKTINDTLGHHVGDLLLIEVAKRLRAEIRESDTVARLGGDEFVVMLTDLESQEDVAVIAEKIVAVVSLPYLMSGHELHTSPSIGIGIYPKDGEDTGSLMKNADTAMYYAKSCGRSNFQFFSEEMTATANRRMAMENSLRQAIALDEFVLYYQPQINVTSGKVVGVEALIRWNHPVMGLVPPSQFIPVAEEIGLIVSLGTWVLRTACTQLRAWEQAGVNNIRMGINISAHQFQQPDFVDVVASIIEETGASRHLIELEITETIAMTNPSGSIETMRRLKAMELGLAIDDFGTGYSSLSYLKLFPISRLKIDRSFIIDIGTDPNDTAITAATIALSKSLGLEVIAEGVETQAQLDFLQTLDCHEAQGYLFSPPIPANAALDYILHSISR